MGQWLRQFLRNHPVFATLAGLAGFATVAPNVFQHLLEKGFQLIVDLLANAIGLAVGSAATVVSRNEAFFSSLFQWVVLLGIGWAVFHQKKKKKKD